ncbi:Kinase-interacting protein 1 [Chionoecetes opilio]|uniref:Kinase-interacting protein 1 n=1 Tax=Chionoecetes opilio TaxID=41210 RepID=A0A8J4YFF0_CHIOP|nr:Kinase-interacting protein 1 [Chionoecetes opilio]
MSTNLLRPFTFGVWATVVTSLAVAMSSCLVLEKTGGARGLARPSATRVWLQLHRGLVGQSVPARAASPVQRVFPGRGPPCCLVITTAYTGNLVGILSSPAYPRRLHTLRDLADSDFSISPPGGPKVEFGEYTGSLIKNPPNNLCTERGKPVPGGRQAAGGRHAAGTHALVEHTYIARLWLKSYPEEELTQLSDRGRKGSGQAVGSDPRRGSGDGPAPPLTLHHLQGAFYVLGIVWVAGGGVLLMEILTHRHQTSRSSQAKPLRPKSLSQAKPPKPKSLSQAKPPKPKSLSQAKPPKPKSLSQARPPKPKCLSQGKTPKPKSLSQAKPLKPKSLSQAKPPKPKSLSQARPPKPKSLSQGKTPKPKSLSQARPLKPKSLSQGKTPKPKSLSQAKPPKPKSSPRQDPKPKSLTQARPPKPKSLTKADPKPNPSVSQAPKPKSLKRYLVDFLQGLLQGLADCRSQGHAPPLPRPAGAAALDYLEVMVHRGKS